MAIQNPKSRKPAKKQVKQSKAKAANYNPLIYGLIAGFAIIFYMYCKVFDFIQDDSFITYRYVKNFTDGHGLVFNIGERVEGYTCFLWVILLSFIKSMGFNFISASQTIGILASILTVIFTYLISSKIFNKEKGGYYNVVFTLIAPLLVASNGSFAYWSVSGMETGLFGMLITFGAYFYFKELKENSSVPYSSIMFLLASLTRPEGNLIFAITVLHRIIYSLKSNSSDKARLINKKNLLWLGLYVIPALIYMAWRYSYYGFLFPNTFYAKTGSSLEYFKTGWEYLVEFAKSYGLHGVLLVLPLITLRSKQKFFENLYLVMIFYIFSAYIIIVGGDVLRPHRFFVPILPVYFILVQEGLHRLIKEFEKKKTFAFGTAVGVIFAIMFAYFVYKGEKEQLVDFSNGEKGLVESMTKTGNWLKTMQTQAGRQLVVATTTIGAISYYSEVILIDMLGLTDKEIAHNPAPIPEISSKQVGWKERNYNVAYLLSRKPDYICFSTGIKPSAYAERGLFTSDEFLNYYYFTGLMYKRKSDSEVTNNISSALNPNYKKAFVNIYNQAMNTTKDKTKLQEAISLFKQSMDEGPVNWGTPYQKIGDIYLDQSNNNKAFENYKKAVELDDYNVLSHYYLYQLYLVKGDTINAMQSIEKVKKYSPEILQ